MSTNFSTPFPFLRLPLELREQIYSLYFNPFDRLQKIPDGEFGGGEYRLDFNLYLANKQIYGEAQTVFRRENVFVRIETPWPTAVNHISSEGLVPIVAASSRASLFRAHHTLVQITAPFHQVLPDHTIILLLDDLHLFARVWYYSALSYPNLNDHLCTTFTLRDPYYPADPKPIPLALQKRLLMPFEQVKGLYRTEFEGFEEGVVREVERGMKIPPPSVQQCCEDCTALMEEGDGALTEGNGEEALNLYIKAFHAIHIIIEGRIRRVLADGFFHDGIEAGRFSGQTGTTVRVILRIKLVARVCVAYLRLQEWAEAAFWGMRSIRIMRDAMDTEFEDFLSEFVGSSDVGLIYLRTAIAFKKMEENCSSDVGVEKELRGYEGDDVASSEKLFSLAAKYLKGRDQKMIRKEIEDHGMRVPDGVFKVGVKESTDVDSMAHLNLNQADGEELDEEGDAA